MKKVFLSALLIFSISEATASIKENLINNLKDINNLTFNFEQNINDKTENGNCTLEYPKKIICKYDLKNKKLRSFLLTSAITNSFSENTNRVWVHTCSLDHKNALNNYLSRGMKIFKKETITI